MILRELLAAVARRWYVILAALLLAAVVFGLARDAGTTYSTKPIVGFLLPGHTVARADNGLEAEGVIAFATTIAESVNNGRPVERYAADDAPLYGAGISREVRIGVPDQGGQWGSSFTRAEIAISVVGDSEAWVRATQEHLVATVLAAATAEQDARGVPDASRIETYVVPLSTRVEEISRGRTQTLLAVGALGAAGLMSGIWGAAMLDRTIARRRPGVGVAGSMVKGEVPR